MKITTTVSLQLRQKSDYKDDFGKQHNYSKKAFEEMVEFIRLRKIYDRGIKDDLIILKTTNVWYDPNETSKKSNKKKK